MTWSCHSPQPGWGPLPARDPLPAPSPFCWAGSRALPAQADTHPFIQLEELSRLVGLEMGAPRADRCSAHWRWRVEPGLWEASSLPGAEPPLGGPPFLLCPLAPPW